MVTMLLLEEEGGKMNGGVSDPLIIEDCFFYMGTPPTNSKNNKDINEDDINKCLVLGHSSCGELNSLNDS